MRGPRHMIDWAPRPGATPVARLANVGSLVAALAHGSVHDAASRFFHVDPPPVSGSAACTATLWRRRDPGQRCSVLLLRGDRLYPVAGVRSGRSDTRAIVGRTRVALRPRSSPLRSFRHDPWAAAPCRSWPTAVQARTRGTGAALHTPAGRAFPRSCCLRAAGVIKSTARVGPHFQCSCACACAWLHAMDVVISSCTIRPTVRGTGGTGAQTSFALATSAPAR